MTEFIDGHRWPTPEPSAAPDAPSRPETPQSEAVPDQQGGTGADDLPPFEVSPIYRHGMVGVLFDPDHVPLLAAHPLFAGSAELLHAAALDIEQEIDSQVKDTRDRQIRGLG